MPDVIWINGAFGVGKTTVAEALVERIPGSTLIDPELVGSMLQVALPVAWQTDDFQDIPQWRDLTRELISGLVRDGRGPLVVPMTVARPAYLDQTVGALRSSGVDLRHFTLVAPAESILVRLRARLGDDGWGEARVAANVAELADARYAEHVDADGRGPVEVAAEIVERLAL